MTGVPVDVGGAAAEQAARLRLSLAGQLSPELLAPMIDVANAPERYTWVPERIARANAELGAKHTHLQRAYNRYVLLSLIAGFSVGDSRYRLPASIMPRYEREFGRIFRQTASLEGSYFDIANDAYLKYLAILTHRLIPVGAEFAEGGARIPAAFCWQGEPHNSSILFGWHSSAVAG